MEKKKFLYLMTRLAVAFKEEFGPERQALYFEFLGNEDPKRLSEVIDEIISDNQWFPKISELKELLHPSISETQQYYNYLDRANKEFEESMRPKQIDYVTRDQAKAMIDALNERWAKEDVEHEKQRNERFEKRREELKKQARLLK